ncbi:MAG: hypothetical protein LBH18_04340 [Spirochaetaceae bacterium]|jgi:hypothetical protein|nr:hypothetical protein [Spirochaetaceae bacterium]
MTRRIFAVITAMLLGFAFASCGESGGESISMPPGKGDPVRTDGVFALFSAGGAAPAAQKIDLLRSNELIPEMEFKEGSESKEKWLEKHKLTEYDFINDPLKLGPKWEALSTGGDSQSNGPAVGEAAAQNDVAAPENSAGGPEYVIKGLSVTYFLDSKQMENLQIPSKSGSEFSTWRIFALNPALSTAEGPAVNASINPADISYKLTYTLKENDPLEFPGSILLKPVNGAYITINAEFKIDEGTKKDIDEIGKIIKDMQDLLNKGGTGPVYKDQNLVGAPLNTEASKALEAAIKNAQEAAAGKMVEVEVPLDDFERNDDGTYKTDSSGGRIPLVVKVDYRVYDSAEITAAKLSLQKAVKDAQDANLTDFVPTSVILSSQSENDKTWKSVTITHSGTYKITITGANGGHVMSTTKRAEFGGRGGYVEAKGKFNAGDVIKVRIGIEGGGLAKLDEKTTTLVEIPGTDYGKTPQGGWPNGGDGGKRYSNSAPGAGGGGATEVYYAGNRDNNAANVDTPEKFERKKDLLLVAGGGGGAGNIPSVDPNLNDNRRVIRGGHAGKEPEPAIRRGKPDSVQEYTLGASLPKPYEHITAKNYKKIYNISNTWYGEYAPANVGSYGDESGKGKNGGNGNSSTFEGSGGGGGGYIGGNAIGPEAISRPDAYVNAGSGGGGSNYVKDGLTQEKNGTATSYGNGQFKIEYVSSGS